MGAYSNSSINNTKVDTNIDKNDTNKDVVLKSFCDVFVPKPDNPTNMLEVKDNKVQVNGSKITYDELQPRVFVFCSSKEGIPLNQSNFNEIKNREDFSKPTGGIWSGTHLPTYMDSNFVSQWQAYSLREMDTPMKEAYTYELNEDSNVLVINNKEDLDSFKASYVKEGKPIPNQTEINNSVGTIISDFFEENTVYPEELKEVSGLEEALFERLELRENREDMDKGEWREAMLENRIAIEEIIMDEYNLYEDSPIIFDYETLSQDYDALYVTDNAIKIEYQEGGWDTKSLSIFDVESLLVLNPDAINWDTVEQVEIETFEGEDLDSIDYTLPSEFQDLSSEMKLTRKKE